MDRRGFFASIRGGRKSALPIFLPYVGDISLLETRCVDCDAPCVGVCEEHIIVLDKNIPSLDFSKGGCTFCKKCALACDKGVLDAKSSGYIEAKISIKTKECLAWNGTMCFSCKDICLQNAISFFGVFRPSIDEKLCVNCGMCVGVCPPSAITAQAVLKEKV